MSNYTPQERRRIAGWFITRIALALLLAAMAVAIAVGFFTYGF